jgi:tryptophanyl-tRNA synthetase
MNTEKRKTVLTCAQPSGKLQLGNYFGAVKNWVNVIEEYDCFFGIVDQHAITVPYTPANLRKATYETLAVYMACGLDPEKCNIFVQSHVIGHTELAWLLGCICPLGQLERMTQFKDKAKKQGQNVGAGLLYYPVLMAADILLYNAHAVPVGEDQKQHIEITRDLAQKFNAAYSPTFNIPEPLIPKTGARIRSLQEPTAKMSKSDPNPNGCIFLLDPPNVIRKKIGSAVTDSGCDIKKDADNKPGITNLLEIYSAACGKSVDELEAQCAGYNYGQFKSEVADAVITLLEPIQQRYNEYVNNKDYLNEVLKKGADAAQKVAYKTLAKAYRKAGFVERPR